MSCMFALWFAAALAGPPPAGLLTIEPGLRVDRPLGLVLLDAEVTQRDAALELLLCPRRSKDHETILTGDFQPQNFQVALLLAGAAPGRPVQFEPFVPPAGQRLKFWVETERDGRIFRVDLREWAQSKDGQAMAADLVFAGSMVVRLPEVETPRFLADDGDVVSIANFRSAIVDIAARSSDKESTLEFHPWKDRIPPLGTPVRLIVEPLVD